MIQTIKKGQHKAIGRRYALKRKRNLYLDITLFGPGLRYDHGNEAHQTAWNKVEGGSFSWFQSHGRAFMTAWRYLKPVVIEGKEMRPESIELTFYYHNLSGDISRFRKVGGVPGLVDESNTLIIPIEGDKVRFGVARYFEGNTIKTSIYLSHMLIPSIFDKVTYAKIGRRYSPINFWFGGQKKAQGEISKRQKASKAPKRIQT